MLASLLPDVFPGLFMAYSWPVDDLLMANS
jgi:hypothetical protein